MRTRKQPRASEKLLDAARPGKAADPKAVGRKGRNRSQPSAEPNAERRIAMIAQAAYYRAELRGFAPGKELEDWLSAAAEVDDQLATR